MAASANVLWLFEKPVTLTAERSNNMSWTPTTFGSGSQGDFRLNMWLLRVDNDKDTVVSNYLPFLLYGVYATTVGSSSTLMCRIANNSVFNNSLTFTPLASDIDTGVAHSGNHQMAWEHTELNPTYNPQNTSLVGFSTGFSIQAPPGFDFDTLSSSSSVAITSATSSVAASSTPQASTVLSSAITTSTSPSTTSQVYGSTSTSPSNALSTVSSDTANENTSSPMSPTILGLAIGLSILAAILFGVAGFWAWRRYCTAPPTYQQTHDMQTYHQHRSQPSYDGSHVPQFRASVPPIPLQKYPVELSVDHAREDEGTGVRELPPKRDTDYIS